MNYRLIDISCPMEAFTFPGNPAVTVSGPFNRVPGNNPEFVYDVVMCTQSGTHIQGAHYFIKDGFKIEQYDIDRFDGPGILVDCRFVDTDVNVDFLKEKLGSLKLADRIILLRTDYFDNLVKSHTSHPSRIGLSMLAANYLVEQKVKMIGIDSPGVESRVTKNFEVNRFLCERNVLLLEGLMNLSAIQSQNFWVSCFPLKLSGVEGTPCRAVVREYI